MIWGDQWICECGFHNVELRNNCRNCGESKDISTAEENALEIVDQISDMTSFELKIEEATTESLLIESENKKANGIERE